MKKQTIINKELVIYQSKSGAIELRTDNENETIWATQAEMANVFGVNPQAITKHIKNIYLEKELNKNATCSKMEQVRTEGFRRVKRELDIYNLEVLIAVGYRINSVTGTKFRQWATKTLRSHIVEGYTINPSRIGKNYDKFLQAIEDVKALLPPDSKVANDDVLELVRLFADTWMSLDAYDKESLDIKKPTKKKVYITTSKLHKDIQALKQDLITKDQATELFATERTRDSLEGIIGNVMQSFNGADVYSSIESKAAHLLYFIIKNHPFIDGNKRTGAYSFVWFLNKSKVLDSKRLTPEALTAITLLIAESNPANKEKLISLVMMLISKK